MNKKSLKRILSSVCASSLLTTLIIGTSFAYADEITEVSSNEIEELCEAEIEVLDSIEDDTKKNSEVIRLYAKQMVADNVLYASSVAGGFSWDSERKSYSWAYYNGLMNDAFMMLEDEQAKDFVEKFYNANINSQGEIVNYKSTKVKQGTLDGVEPIRPVFDLLASSDNKASYQKAIQFLYTMLESQITYENCGYNLCHKQSNGVVVDSWKAFPVALDGLYMAQPFFMECANAIDNGYLNLVNSKGEAVTSAEIYEKVYMRMLWISDNMYNSDTHLYNHAYNPNSETVNGICWSRAAGWYAMALVDVIDMMPSDSTEHKEMKADLISKLPKLFDGLLEYQDRDTGLWYNIPNDFVSTSNRLETSGSAMFSYAMLKAYDKGYVSEGKYAKSGIDAFNGIVDNKVTENGGRYSIADIYKQSGASNVLSSYYTSEYLADEAKGTGAVIMAAVYADSVAEKYVASGDNKDESSSSDSTSGSKSSSSISSSSSSKTTGSSLVGTTSSNSKSITSSSVNGTTSGSSKSTTSSNSRSTASSNSKSTTDSSTKSTTDSSTKSTSSSTGKSGFSSSEFDKDKSSSSTNIPAGGEEPEFSMTGKILKPENKIVIPDNEKEIRVTKDYDYRDCVKDINEAVCSDQIIYSTDEVYPKKNLSGIRYAVGFDFDNENRAEYTFKATVKPQRIVLYSISENSAGEMQLRPVGYADEKGCYGVIKKVKYKNNKLAAVNERGEKLSLKTSVRPVVMISLQNECKIDKQVSAVFDIYPINIDRASTGIVYKKSEILIKNDVKLAGANIKCANTVNPINNKLLKLNTKKDIETIQLVNKESEKVIDFPYQISKESDTGEYYAIIRARSGGNYYGSYTAGNTFKIIAK